MVDDEAATAAIGELTSFRSSHEERRLKRITQTQLKLWRCILIMAAVVVAMIPAYIVCVSYLVSYYGQLTELKAQIKQYKLILEACNSTTTTGIS